MEQFGPGKTISFRLPNDTPEHVFRYLNRRKKRLGRKFSSEIAPLFVDSIAEKALQGTQPYSVSIPIPKGLSDEQKDWISHPSTRALIGQLLYQMVKEPVKPLQLDLPTPQASPDDESKSSFKTNKTIQNFAKKTFLNFDDDED